MPTNNWQHQLFVTDLVEAIQRTDDPAALLALRNQLVYRIRTADFYDPADIVLRGLVDDLATAATPEQLGRDWDYFYLWADQGQRVWIETTFTLEKFNEHQAKTGRPPFVPLADEATAVISTAVLIHDAFAHPVLVDAVVTWCDATGTDPATLQDDDEFEAVAQVLNTGNLLEFHARRREMTQQAYRQHAERAALVLLAGPELARLRDTPVVAATTRAVHVVAQLGTPTGYENEPRLLARAIHNGKALERM